MNGAHRLRARSVAGSARGSTFAEAARRCVAKGSTHGPWRQVELFEPAEAQGRAHRERLRATRRVEEDRAEARLGDCQQTGRRRSPEEEQHAEKGSVEEERRKEDRAEEIIFEEDVAKVAAQEDVGQEDNAQEDDPQDVAIAALTPEAAVTDDRTLAALEVFRSDIERLSREFPDDRDFWPAYAEQANRLEASSSPALRDYVRESILRTILTIRSTRG
jgi:hypothetical protein